MSLEIDILNLLRTKENFNRFSRFLKVSNLSKESFVILKDMEEYFKSKDEIDWNSFDTWFKTIKHPSYSSEKLDFFSKVFENLSSSEEEEEMTPLLLGLIKREFATAISNKSSEIADGTSEESLSVLKEMIRSFEVESQMVKSSSEFVTEDLDEILDHVVAKGGYEWRLEELNMSAGPIRGGDFIIVSSRPDSGKCQSPDTPILMADGRVKLAKDVIVGDVLAGPYMNNTVLSTTSGIDVMHKVSYPWGDSYTVNDPHIISIKRSKNEGKHKSGDVLNVPINEYISWPEGRKQRYKGWKSAWTGGVPVTTKIKPYLLGLWLGDGTTGKPQITTLDTEVVDAFSKEYGVPTSFNYSGKAKSYYFSNGLISDLRDAGVFEDKRVPSNYMQATMNERLELLAGLLDADGYCSNSGWEITQERKVLAEQILFLARSVGLHATLNDKTLGTNNFGMTGKTYYRVIIGTDIKVPVKIARHRNAQGSYSSKPKRNGLSFGFKVKTIGLGEYVGWELSGDRLYMLGDFTVTHNTTLLSSEATFIAKQIHNDKNVIWINNEEEGRKVKSRIYQAALAKTVDELDRDRDGSKAAYIKAVGRQDKIRVVDNKRADIFFIEDVIRNNNPGLIIFDQLWKVYGFEKESSTDVDRYTRLFSWARELATIYDCPVITVHQADNTAHGKEFIEMNQLYQSKTGLQGEADCIITLGRNLDDDTKKNSRGLYVPKNKLVGGPRTREDLRNGKFEIEILPTIARFKGVF